MFKTILMAYDGSPSADKALDMALDIAARYGATLRVISVVRAPDFADDEQAKALVESITRHYHLAFESLRHRASAKDIEPQFSVLAGHPAEQIILQAESHGVDLIVMGHRGKSLFQRLRLGSVSKQVMQYAHCAVLIVQ